MVAPLVVGSSGTTFRAAESAQEGPMRAPAQASWHAGCTYGHMEFAIAIIVLAVGLMLERGRRGPETVRADLRRRR